MSEVATVEVAEKVVSEAPKLPTREELRGKGWTAPEMDSAEKHGMIAKVEEKPKAEPVKAEEPKEEKTKEEPVKVEDRKNSLPEFSMTPDQEAEFSKIFPPGTAPRGLYFRMKNERQARQQAQAELEKERSSRTALEARLKALEAVPAAPRVDAEGNPIPDEDPEDRPLTLKQLKAMREAEEKEIAQKRADNDQRARSVADAQRVQEEFVREQKPDFDKTVELAADLMKNIESLLPEKWQQTKAVKLIRDLQIAAAQADKIDLDEYHAPWIAYELGQLHPNYGKQDNGDTPGKTGTLKDPKANGGLTPEQMKRMEKNTQRGTPSASIPGGSGKRSISVDDVSAEDLNRMSYKERQNFRSKHPERYAKITRG